MLLWDGLLLDRVGGGCRTGDSRRGGSREAGGRSRPGGGQGDGCCVPSFPHMGLLCFWC